jgi:PAS domain S-box-containing protein
MTTLGIKVLSEDGSLARSPQWDAALSAGHSVQFYEDDSFLLDGLTRFIGAAIAAGDSALVVANKAHRTGLVERLTESGLNLGIAAEQGRYIALDADETLAKFMVNDHPDGRRFEAVVGGLVAQLANGGGKSRCVAIFGEMVAILWAGGKEQAAIELEQLWNQLAKKHVFQLHCAYPLNLFRCAQDGAGVERICAEHTHVAPGEEYTSLATEKARLSAIAVLQQKAQALETEMRERERVQAAARQSERELRESEQRFRVITDASPVMVWMSGSDKLCYYFNKSWLNFVGRTLEQEAGNGWAENVHPDDFDRCLEIYTSAFDARRQFEMEYRLRHHSGQYRWILDRGVPRYTPDGTFEGYVGGCLDIHEQKEAREVQRRLAAIVESSDDAIASKDLNGIVTSWNKSAERLFGYKAEEIIGKPVTVIIPPELHKDEEMILGKIRRGERIEHFETVRLTKSGERIDVSLTISPIKDASGRVIGAAKIVRNITENKKIERALRTTEKLAAAGRLAATVAHEINNPLESITNLVYLAKRDLQNTARAAAHLTLATRELDRVAHIARQTLGFYRDTSSPVRFSLTQTIDDLLALYENRFEVRNIKVIKQYQGDIEIKALAGEIRQAISNLITNAIDAMPDGGPLLIRASRSREWNNSGAAGVRITILDTGGGIAPQHRKNLFQPFFTTKEDVGTGLGLWITRNIVEKHHGLIHVKSRAEAERHGTAFSIFLPLETVPDVEGAVSANGKISLTGAVSR